jgi:hypothetical protein
MDAIIPLADPDQLRSDESFWDTQDATKRRLMAKGRYITHLFRANQVFLRPDWDQHLVPRNRSFHALASTVSSGGSRLGPQ